MRGGGRQHISSSCPSANSSLLFLPTIPPFYKPHIFQSISVDFSRFQPYSTLLIPNKPYINSFEYNLQNASIQDRSNRPIQAYWRFVPLLVFPDLSHLTLPTATLTIYYHLGPDSNTSESTGVIKSVATEPSNMADRNVNASVEEPTYEVSCLPYHDMNSATALLTSHV